MKITTDGKLLKMALAQGIRTAAELAAFVRQLHARGGELALAL